MNYLDGKTIVEADDICWMSITTKTDENIAHAHKDVIIDRTFYYGNIASDVCINLEREEHILNFD